MTHRQDTRREDSRRHRRNEEMEQAPRHHQGQRYPSVSRVQQQPTMQQPYQQPAMQHPYQQPYQQQPYQPYQPQPYQQQHATNYASTAPGSHVGYATPQGQYAASDYDAHSYPQAPSTPRAHQGSAQDDQYSPGRDGPRVRFDGYQEDPEDCRRRTESFVRDCEDGVVSSRPSRSDRDIRKKKKREAKTAIDTFDTAWGTTSTQASQYNSGPAPDPEYPDCGDGPNYGGSSYAGY